jgi:hypothetical protein
VTDKVAARPRAIRPPPVDVGPELGDGGEWAIADFDNDGRADALRVFGRGGLIYKGKGGGEFEPAKDCKVAGRGKVSVGDFDGDGRLDLFVAGERCAIWENRGNFEFVEVLGLSGELAYKGNADVVSAQACDFNGDGRTDLALFYSNAPPALFFNRGFRSFGFANGLDLDKSDLIPALKDGLQAGCVADLDGDGVDELIAVSKAGEAWTLSLEGDVGRAVRVALPSAATTPVTVTAWQKGRCLGAWNLEAGREVRVSSRDAGDATLKWVTGAGKAREQVVRLEKKSARVVLEP